MRRVRRFFRKYLHTKGKGKGEGKQQRRLTGKGVSSFLQERTDQEFEDILFGKGGGKGRGFRSGIRSTGKGFGRKTNPRGQDGQIMQSSGNNGQCNSLTHLRRDCPHETGGTGGSQGKGHTAARSVNTIFYTDTPALLYIMASEVAHQDGFSDTEPLDQVGRGHVIPEVGDTRREGPRTRECLDQVDRGHVIREISSINLHDAVSQFRWKATGTEYTTPNINIEHNIFSGTSKVNTAHSWDT